MAQAGKSFDSVHTDLTREAEAVARESCKSLSADAETGSVEFACAGCRGIEVRVAEGDLRSFVAFGPNAGDEIAPDDIEGDVLAGTVPCSQDIHAMTYGIVDPDLMPTE